MIWYDTIWYVTDLIRVTYVTWVTWVTWATWVTYVTHVMWCLSSENWTWISHVHNTHICHICHFCALSRAISKLSFLLWSLQIIFPVTLLRMICNHVAGGWEVVGDLYDGRPPSLSRLAPGLTTFNDPDDQSAFIFTVFCLFLDREGVKKAYT